MKLKVIWKPYYLSSVKLKDCVDKCFDVVLWLLVVNTDLERINSIITSHIFVAIIVPFSCFGICCINMAAISIPPFYQTWLTIKGLWKDISDFFRIKSVLQILQEHNRIANLNQRDDMAWSDFAILVGKNPFYLSFRPSIIDRLQYGTTSTYIADPRKTQRFQRVIFDHKMCFHRQYGKIRAVWRKGADLKFSSFFVMVSSWYHHGRPRQVNPQVTPSYLELRYKLCSDSYSSIE